MPRHLCRLRFVVAAALLAGAALAHGAPGAKGENPRSRSIGSPTDGRLEGAAEVQAGPTLRLRRPRGARWGLPHLVAMLSRSSRVVAKRHPGSVLLVGDLSREAGGDLPGHASHESGRDADVGFYFVNADGKVEQPPRFLKVDWDGRAVGAEGLTFDDERNWLLVQAWVTDPGARVQHIFVADPIRKRLLNHARKKGVYLPVLHRAAIAMKQPSSGQPHDDHFHVRIQCPRSQRDVCIPEPARGKKTPEREA